jgi:uncharacterized membrane protein (UPF0127 family)
MKQIRIHNISRPSTNTISAGYCSSFLCRLKGLMLQRQLQPGHGLLLIEKHDSQVDAAIHMFFMRFDIAVIWINSEYKVVDVQQARRWPPFYIPRSPACFILETNFQNYSDFIIGDKVAFNND